MSTRVTTRIYPGCTRCDAGKYCETEGLPEPSGECDPGYYCKEAAYSKTPDDGETG